MSQTVHLLCGVPGSGKTWVANKLTTSSHNEARFMYIPHDEHQVDQYYLYLVQAAKRGTVPVLAEAPFRVSVLIEELERFGLEVKTYYITDDESVIKARYEARSHKPFPKQHSSNLARYNARQWDVRGTSDQILNHLKGLIHG